MYMNLFINAKAFATPKTVTKFIGKYGNKKQMKMKNG